MTSERSIVKSKFMEVAMEVIREERNFLEEVGSLGVPKRDATSKARNM